MTDRQTDRQTDRISIALCGDCNYLEPLETLIKSVCCHHTNVDFHLLHSGDMPTAWIRQIQNCLKPLGCTLNHYLVPRISFPLSDSAIKREAPLTDASFYRYFIPEFIADKRVLYLDGDIIVDGSLSALFETDMGIFPIAAVADIGLSHQNHYYAEFEQHDPNLVYQGGKIFKPYFNSGVLLFNGAVLHGSGLTRRLLEANSKYRNVHYGDQDIFNFVFFRKWFDLGCKYNYQIGAKIGSADNSLYPIVEKPVIIHYTTGCKPWLEAYCSDSPYHELYHIYQQKSWQEIAYSHTVCK